MGALKPKRRMSGAQQYARAHPVDTGESTSFVGIGLDWGPRHGQDLDAGIRMQRDDLIPVPYPRPHVIGMLSGFMPQIDYWRFAKGNTIGQSVPGPYQGEPVAPGTEGYYPNWYRDLIKEY